STEGHEAGDVFIIDQTVASSMFHSAISRIGDGRMLVSWAETSVTGWAQMAKIKGLVIEDSKPSQVIDLTTQYSYPRRLVSTETGEGVCLVWADERVGPSKTELVYAFYNASLTPASGRHLTSHIGESRSPAIASFQGNPVVVWEDSRNGNFEIYMTHRVPVSDAAVPAEEGAAPRPMILTPYEPAFIPGAGFGILAFLAYVAKHKELLLLIPAYSRLSNREIVENPTRKAILEHISQEPGVNFSSLMTDLDLKNGVLSHHLRTLERAGHIRSKKDGSLRRYYPSDCVLPMSLDEKLLYTLARNPGISETGLAEKLGVTRQVINYHIGKLLENRKVAVRREGRRTRCYALSLTPN
ncbi:MAG: winged helix-turn-helix transcriptional regulator, partial [Candidatus Thermoplasmatota archaeon]|nr:winged helix-turn-helix transcriptional regulator [Candidatus Thermoplasmatota archaeon]